MCEFDMAPLPGAWEIPFPFPVEKTAFAIEIIQKIQCCFPEGFEVPDKFVDLQKKEGCFHIAVRPALFNDAMGFVFGPRGEGVKRFFLCFIAFGQHDPFCHSPGTVRRQHNTGTGKPVPGFQKTFFQFSLIHKNPFLFTDFLLYICGE
jgi:hypothetical protein